MKRYLCRECGTISDEEKGCPSCGKALEKVSISRGLEGSVPYIMAGIAAFLLIFSFLTDRFLLIWLTFPIIAVGLIYDHLYQKHVEKVLRDMIR